LGISRKTGRHRLVLEQRDRSSITEHSFQGIDTLAGANRIREVLGNQRFNRKSRPEFSNLLLG